MSNKIYTDEELLEILKKQFELNPNSVSSDFRPKNGLPHYQVYNNRFNGFTRAKYLAGITSELEERSSWSKEKIIQTFNDIYGENQCCDLSYDEMCKKFKYLPSVSVICKYFESVSEVLNICNIITLQNKPKEYLLFKLDKFIKENGKLPMSHDFDKANTGYPSRKTFEKYFGSVNNALVELGYGEYKIVSSNRKVTFNEIIEYKNMSLEQKKEFLINKLYEFIKEFNHVPTTRELETQSNYPTRHHYRDVFGGYNNALKEAGLKLNQVSQHDDEFLKQEFLRFINENGRTPYLHEFNCSEYPSFWCYQNRFGSWNQAFIAYGFEPNDSNRKYYLDNGEVCFSSYEFDISRWLIQHNIEYTRDIPYIQIHKKYKGRMNCDYKIINNNEVYYVEMAGFYPRNLEYKLSSEENMYAKKLHYKIKLLNESAVNYLIIYPNDIKTKSLDEIFSFIKLN